MLDVAIVDYGMSNLRSVAKAIAHVAPAARVAITADPAEVSRARRVIVPGQSAMPDTMRALAASGLEPAVRAAAAARPFLGICLGLQMLFEASDEGPTACLGVLPGRVRRFADGARDARGAALKVPHMGWNRVRQARPHPLWSGIAQDAWFYFAHSYHPVPGEPDLTAGTADYPVPFTCAIARANIFAVQFHPEKSQSAGLTLLANFVAWDGRA